MKIKEIQTKYDSKCFKCARPLKQGTKVRWYVDMKAIRCMNDCYPVSKTVPTYNSWQPTKFKGFHRY